MVYMIAANWSEPAVGDDAGGLEACMPSKMEVDEPQGPTQHPPWGWRRCDLHPKPDFGAGAGQLDGAAPGIRTSTIMHHLSSLCTSG